MKVCVINTLYYPNIMGGAEISTQIACEELVRRTINVIVISLAADGKEKIDYINGVKVYYLSLANLYWPLSGKNPSVLKPFWHLIDVKNFIMMNKVKNILDIENPDLVHTNNLFGISTGVWGIVKKKKIPLIHTLRDYYLLCPPSKMFSKGKNCINQCRTCAFYAWPKKRMSNYVDAVVGISNFILNKHLELGFFDKTFNKEVIYNPVKFPSGDSFFSYQKQLDNKTSITFGYIGRITFEKGVELLIEALSRIKNLDCQLRIAGTGEYSYVNMLKKKYSDSRIHFDGFCNADDFYRQIDVLVVPSKWHEPFGRIVIEAYSHGIPVIGANTGGLPEIIFGGTGVIFDINNSHTLSEKLIDVAVQLKNGDLDPNFIINKSKEFIVNHHVDKILKIYTALSKSKSHQ